MCQNCDSHCCNLDFNKTVEPDNQTYTVGKITCSPQEGWVCPLCGGVYSPTVQLCFFCGENKVTC
jgi:hypothetical protein